MRACLWLTIAGQRPSISFLTGDLDASLRPRRRRQAHAGVPQALRWLPAFRVVRPLDRRRPHGLGLGRARCRRARRPASAVVREELLRRGGRPRADPRGTRLPTLGRRLRRHSGRHATRVARADDRHRALARHERAVPEGRELRRRHLLHRAAARRRDQAVRHPRSVVAAPVPHGRGRHQGRLGAHGVEEGRGESFREHGHRAARLQRYFPEDAGRPASRRRPAHDVHGRVRAECERASARPPARRGLLHHVRRGRGVGRRPEVPHEAWRFSVGRRRLHARVLQP